MGFFVTLAVFALTTVLQEFLRPKPDFENARPANLGDFQFPTTTEGRPIPLIVGTVKLSAPNVGWYGDLRQVPIKVKQKTGIFSFVRQIVGYRYYIGVQLDFCLGTTGKLLRLWWGEDELISTPQVGAGTISVNAPDFLGGEDLGRGGIIGDFTYTTGAQTTANTYLSAFQDIGGSSPVYKGTSQVIIEGVYIGTSTDLSAIAAEMQRIPDGLDLATAHIGENDAGDHLVNTVDANPANFIYEIITDTDWGLGESAGSIDLSSFRTAGGTWADEGNGISMVIDTQKDAIEILREIERQTDSYLYFDQASKTWKINLVRGGYTIGSVPALTDANVISIDNFTRAGWGDTTNEVRIGFADRAKDYFETFATAHDTANFQLQGSQHVTATEKYPGVKDATLANAIAWREIRTLSYPLARMTVRVDRTFYDLVPGDVVSYTSTTLGLTQLPMRVQRIDYGNIDDPTILIDLVQDLFEARTGSYADPAGTGWTAPADTLVAVPADEALVMEAPRGVLLRADSEARNRILAAAAFQDDGATDFRIYQNESGSYVEDGTSVGGFLYLGELRNAISAGTTNPTTVSTETIEIDPAASTVAELLEDLLDGLTAGDVGLGLQNLLFIGDRTASSDNGGEFVCPTSFADGTTHVDLDVVYRGLLDTTPQDHAAGTSVFLVFGANVLSQTDLGDSGTVNVKLRTRSRAGGEIAEGTATTHTVVLANRYDAPYPPTALELNTDDWGAATVDLDDVFTGGTGTDFEDWGLQVEWLRRDFRVFDEVDNLTVDAVTRDSAFLTDTSTEYRVLVYNDPTGTNDLLVTTAWDGTNRVDVSRTEILANMPTPGAVPSELRVVVETRHTVDATVIEAVQDLDYSFDAESTALANDNNGGTAGQNTWVEVIASAPDTGTYDIAIGSAFPTNGDVEVRLNGGGGSVEIAFGATTGTFSATAGDSIEIRHTSSDSGLEKFCQVDPPTSTAGGYAIFV